MRRKQGVSFQAVISSPITGNLHVKSILNLACSARLCRSRANAAITQCRDLYPVAKNILYFDLETQKSAEDVGGWDKIRDMRMSIGVTYSTARQEYRIYGEKQVDDLLTDLQRADLVVGFNNLRFDYEVLHYYTVFDLTQVPTLDVLVDLQA